MVIILLTILAGASLGNIVLAIFFVSFLFPVVLTTSMIFNDYLVPRYGDESLRYSILTVVVVATFWAAIHFLLANKTLREDLAAAEAD